MSNRLSSFPAAPALPIPAQPGGRVDAQPTLGLPLSRGNIFTCDGTATIRALPEAPLGTLVWVYFTGAPTLVHSTKLVLSTGENYAVIAGDFLQFFSRGDGVWSISLGGLTTVVRYDLAQSLTEAQEKVARTNIYAAPFDALAFSGLQINGGMEVSQEFVESGTTLANNTAKYAIDMVEGFYNHGAATAVVTATQVPASSFEAVLPGFRHALRLRATTALSSIANGDFACWRWKMEGTRVARLGWGASGALPIAYAFKFYATRAATHMIRVSNSAGDRFYHAEFTVAIGWNQITGTIAGDTSGTWLTTTGTGLVFEVFCAGRAASPATPNAWGATGAVSSTNSNNQNQLSSSNDDAYLTGLMVFPGLELPSSDRYAYLLRPFATEIEDCKRYFLKSYLYTQLPAAAASNYFAFQANGTGGEQAGSYSFGKSMRAAPTVKLYSRNTGAIDKIYNATATADETSTGPNSTNEGGFSGLQGTRTTNNIYQFHYTARSQL